MSLLSPVEHAKSTRPSTVMTAYLLSAVLCDAVRARSMWQSSDRPLAILFSFALAMELIALGLEAIEKRNVQCQQDQRDAPEEFAGLFNRSFYWWLNSLIRRGFGTILSFKDLCPLEEKMSAHNINARFQRVWSKGMHPGLHGTRARTLY